MAKTLKRKQNGGKCPCTSKMFGGQRSCMSKMIGGQRKQRKNKTNRKNRV